MKTKEICKRGKDFILEKGSVCVPVLGNMFMAENIISAKAYKNMKGKMANVGHYNCHSLLKAPILKEDIRAETV